MAADAGRSRVDCLERKPDLVDGVYPALATGGAASAPHPRRRHASGPSQLARPTQVAALSKHDGQHNAEIPTHLTRRATATDAAAGLVTQGDVESAEWKEA
jgi:hypothetical protein